MQSLSIQDSEQVQGGILFVPFNIASAPAMLFCLVMGMYLVLRLFAPLQSEKDQGKAMINRLK